MDKTAELYDEHAINHGVIFVQDPSSKEEVNRFKDSWIRYNSNAYCIVNLFDSEEQFYSVYNSGEFLAGLCSVLWFLMVYYIILKKQTALGIVLDN